MTAVAAASTFLLHMPAPPVADGAGTSRALAPVFDINSELEAARELRRDAAARFAALTYGAGWFDNSRAKRWLHRNVLPPELVGLCVMLLGSFGSLGSGAAAEKLGFYQSTCWSIAGVVGATVAVTGAALFIADKVADRIAKRQSARLVSVDDIAPLVTRFDAASATQKVVIGRILRRWLYELQAKRAITPGAAEQLERVVRELPTSNEALARADEVERLLRDADGAVDARKVRA